MGAKFLSLKNTSLLCILVVLAVVGAVFNDYFYLEFWGELLLFLLGVIAIGWAAWKYITHPVVKWAVLAVIAMSVVNLIPAVCYDLFHSFPFDISQSVYKGLLTIVFLMTGVFGIRKITNKTERISMTAFLVIGGIGLWLRLLIPCNDESNNIYSLGFTITNLMSLLPLVAVLLFFVASLNETSDRRLRKSILSSMLGCLVLLSLLAGTEYYRKAYDFSFYDGYGWLSTDVAIISAFISGCLMSVYFIHLFIKSRYTMKSVCIPTMLIMVCLGVLSAFIMGNGWSDGFMLLELICFIIASFGMYKLYKKL